MVGRRLLVAALLAPLAATALAPPAAADTTLGVCAPPFTELRYDNAGPDVFVGVYVGSAGARVYTDEDEFGKRCRAG